MQSSKEGRVRGGNFVRASEAIGLFVLLVLAARAHGAEIDPAALRLTQGAAFRIAASYEESAYVCPPGNAAYIELGGISVGVLAVWTVRTVARDRVVLDAECLEAHFAVFPPAEGAGERMPFARVWKHERPWRGKLEVVLTAAGAALNTDTIPIVTAIQREEPKVPVISSSQPEDPTPADLLAARIRRGIERLATEIFRDELEAALGHRAGRRLDRSCLWRISGAGWRSDARPGRLFENTPRAGCEPAVRVEC